MPLLKFAFLPLAFALLASAPAQSAPRIDDSGVASVGTVPTPRRHDHNDRPAPNTVSASLDALTPYLAIDRSSGLAWAISLSGKDFLATDLGPAAANGFFDAVSSSGFVAGAFEGGLSACLPSA